MNPCSAALRVAACAPSGTEASACVRVPEEVASTRPRACSPLTAPPATSSVLAAPTPRKIAPQAAMPTAIPTWRKVSLIPAAIPLCSLGTTLRGTSAMTGLSRPTPIPLTTNPASGAVHSESRLSPPASSRPTPVSASPALIRYRACTLASAIPAGGAAMNEATVIGR